MHRHTLIAGGLASVLVSIFVTGAALAESTELDPVVVLADRTAALASSTGQTITVFDAADIRASQAIGVADLAQTAPGITFSRTGGPGQTTSLFIRGADSDQTLVLIDGVEMDDPTQPGGDYDMSNLLVGDIDHIEILRGAHSTLWGSQAIGGVINIETTAPTKALQGEALAEGGAFGTQNYNLAVGGTHGPLSVRLSGGYYATDGIPAFDTRLGGTGDNGYRNTGFSGRLNYQITPAASLDLRGAYTTAWTSFDGYDTPTGAFGFDGEYSKTAQYLAYGGLHFDLFSGLLKNLVAAQYVDSDRRNFDPHLTPGETFYGFGSTTRFEYQGVAQLIPGYSAVFGAQHLRSQLTTDTPAWDVVLSPTLAHTTQDSVYGQLKGVVLPGLTVETGLRYDDDQSYGGHVTAQASAVQALNGGDTLLRASFGQGFKAPALYQLYGPYGAITEHMPALKPETSDSWDLGVQQFLFSKTVNLSATYFGRDTKGLITYVAPGVYANIGRATAAGLELQAEWRLDAQLTLTANYTFDRARDLTDHVALIRRPRDAANLSLAYTWPIRLNTSLAVRYSGSSPDTGYDALGNAFGAPLKAYTVVDIRAAYPLTERLELFGRVENLFNQHYETAYPYGSPGVGGFAGVRARF